MSDLDQALRRIADLEAVTRDQGYRIKALERAVSVTVQAVSFGSTKDVVSKKLGNLWCECGRDLCRAPDCPSHKTDPLGR